MSNIINLLSNGFLISPSVQNYHWGKIGSDSLCARLLTKINPSLPYAELWFGDHPKASSTVNIGEEEFPLKTILEENPSLLGNRVTEQFGSNLPFLSKILSINLALSIQVHPQIKDAHALNSEDPSNYPDTNHKPEIAVALTKVEMLHGWISEKELLVLLKDIPTIKNFFEKHGLNLLNWTEDSKKELVRILFARTSIEVSSLNNLILKNILSLSNRSKTLNNFLELANQVNLIDAGLILSLFLRPLTLEAGESIFTPPGEIHAYLSGDLFECMANSDNVIRAGLTPKYQDYKALINCANFKEGTIIKKSPVANKITPKFKSYFSSANEFEVLSLLDSSDTITYTKGIDSFEILLLSDGAVTIVCEEHSHHLQKGQALFLPANINSVELKTELATLFRIVVPLALLPHPSKPKRVFQG